MTRAARWVAGILFAGLAWMLWHLPAGDIATAGRNLAGDLPAGPWIAVNAGRAVAAAGLAAALAFLFDAAGVGLLRWLGRVRPAGSVRLVAVFAGFAAVSLGLLGLSAAGLWFPAVLWGMLVLVGLAVRRHLRAEGREWTVAGRALWRSASWPVRAAWGLVLGWSIPLLLPPEIHVDALEYHLGFPQQVLLAHRLIGTDAYMAWTSALAADLPNVYPILAGLDPAAKLLRPVLAVLGSLALLRALRIRLGSSAALGAGWLALVIPAASATFFTAKNDATVCGVVLGGMAMALGASCRRRPSRAAVLAGGACGLLLSMKIVVAPVAAVVAGIALWRVGGRGRWRAAAALSAGAVAAVLPWLAKSWLFTGDPVYPLGVAWAPGLFSDGVDGQTARALALVMDGSRSAWDWPGETARFAIANALPALAILPVIAATRLAAPRLVTIGAWLGIGLMVAALRFTPGNVERFAAPAFVMGNLVACALVFGGRGRGWRPARIALLCLGLAAHARVTAALLGGPGGAGLGGYLAGRASGEAFRREATGSYGRILPAVGAAVRGAGERGSGVLRDREGRSCDPGRILAVGEALAFGLPARVIGEGLGPRVPWRIAREADSERRMTIRYRQADVRWVLHNPWKAYWARLEEQPYAWDPRMLHLYETWARRHLRLRAFSGREDPVWGSHWLFEVMSGQASAPMARVLFLPGAERALARPTRAALAGDLDAAIAGFRAAHRLLPGVVAVDAALGHALVKAGRYGEAYPLVRSSVDAGLVYETNLFDWAIASGRLGRRAEAEEALRRAAEVCPGWVERLAVTRIKAGVAR